MLKNENEYLGGVAYEVIEIIGNHNTPPEQSGIVLCSLGEKIDLQGVSLVEVRGRKYLLIVDSYKWPDYEGMPGIFIPQDSDINIVLEEIKKDFGERSEFAEDISPRCRDYLIFEEFAKNPDPSHYNLTQEAMAFLCNIETIFSVDQCGELRFFYIHDN